MRAFVVLCVGVMTLSVAAGGATAAFPGVNGRIAFVSSRDGNREIYTMNPDGSDVTRLTNAPGEDSEPAWSPDGGKIAFQSDRDGNHEIYVMDADGSNQTRVTSDSADDLQPAWSPDGQHLAFSSNRGTGRYAIYTIGVDGSSLTQVASSPVVNDSEPAWSPDGQTILFSQGDGCPSACVVRIYAVNADGTNMRQITNGYDFNPSWSPDSQRITFIRTNNLGDTPGIYVANADGSNPTLLKDTSAGDMRSPVWSPDGQKMAFHSLRNGNDNIYVMDADGTGEQQVTFDTGCCPVGSIFPDWGPAAVAAPQNVVTNTNDSGPGSLRAAIEFANANPGPDTISFAIRTSDPGFNGQWFTITPTSPGGEPPLSDDGTTVDGASETAFVGDTNPAGPEIEINGSQLTFGAGLNLQSSNNVVDALSVVGFAQPTMDGIHISRTGNVVAGCYLGVDPTGTVAAPNNQGIGIDGNGNRVGGTNASDRNVIAGNSGQGVANLGASGNVIEGNYIGTNAAGTSAVPNGFAAIFLNNGSANITITRNVLSGNTQQGIQIQGSTDVTATANHIGTDASGTAAVGNGFRGIDIVASSNVTIGGPNASDRNLISGNGSGGVSINGNSAGTLIRGNYIGTNAAGTGAIANGTGSGIFVGTSNGSPSNITIRNNLISGNSGGGGIQTFRFPSSTSNIDGLTVQGNLIGTDASGTSAIQNGPGLALWGVNNVVLGGTNASQRNVISGNRGDGVTITQGSTGVLVQGNYIGTNASGTGALANGNFGISIQGTAVNVTVGGTAAGAGNVISANGSVGIAASADGSVIQGNRIGTDASGTAALPNQRGIGVLASNVRIGGTAAGAGNTIAFNTDAGVTVNSGTGNAIRRNSIFSNGGLGIDLDGGGVTPNDPGDGDTGPNQLMNFPVIQQAVSTPNGTIVSGTIDTANPASVTIELFGNAFPSPGPDPSGYGEGAVFLGTATPAANGRWSVTVPGVAPGTIVSATATDANGNTSEFARDAVVK